MEHLKEFCTPRQLEIVEAVIKYPNKQLAANALGVSRSTVRNAVKGAEKKAAANGVAPNRDVNHRTMEGFNAKFVTSRYDGEGNLQGQYVRQEREKFDLDALLEDFRDGFKDELKGLHTPVSKPVDTVDKLMNCYMIGDHHLGMYAWSKETNDDNYDTDISVKLLEDAVDSLVARSPDSKHGLLVNLGDFFHSNNIKGETAGGTQLDTDGRYGRTVRMGVNLLKRIVIRLLEKHEIVTCLNVRGNHDSDPALWLNEAMKMYFENEPRVIIPDNYSKFTHLVYGNSLIVTHHGDKITPQRIYESVTRRLSVEWGQAKYRFGWLGHLHHKESKEIGGMLFEQFNILASGDSYHASAGYGSSRSMTCIVLSEQYGEDSRVIVNPDRIDGEKND
jgi:UDP-2,3-diacylglucosamine pyrophosphatase LpxH